LESEDLSQPTLPLLSHHFGKPVRVGNPELSYTYVFGWFPAFPSSWQAGIRLAATFSSASGVGRDLIDPGQGFYPPSLPAGRGAPRLLPGTAVSETVSRWSVFPPA
jgi:hypothetical protein